EMQRAAAQKTPVEIDHREVADRFRQLEFRSRQHDPLGRVAIDQSQDRRDIVHHRLAHDEARARAGILRKGIGLYAADHAVTILVPSASPARTRSSTLSAAPGAMRTCATPPANAASAASILACIPPLATPSETSRRLSAAVSTGRTCFAESRTPETSV